MCPQGTNTVNPEERQNLNIFSLYKKGRGLAVHHSKEWGIQSPNELERFHCNIYLFFLKKGSVCILDYY